MVSLIWSNSQRPSPLFKRVGSCITLFEACSTFTHVPACVLAESPKATLYIEVLSMVNPFPLLRLLPAGATSCRVGFTPTENRRLFTAH